MGQAVLASRLASLSESATVALNAMAKQMAAEGKTVYNLTIGELTTDTPDYIQEYVATKLAQNKYTPAAGLPELRQKIAAHTKHFYNLDWIEAANVVVTAGAKPALHAIMLALLNPDDEVILPTPVWTSYNHIVELAGGRVVEAPLTENYDLDVAAIMAKVSSKTKLIILDSPHNPTGAVFSRAALQKLADQLKDKSVYVLADDMYGKLVYEADFALVPTMGWQKLIIVNGFSKSQALTGWRIGYLIAESDLAQAATKILSHITGNAPLPSQYAAIAALERDDQPPANTLESLKRQRELVDQALSTIPGLRHNRPAGAFYVFLDLRELTQDSSEWCQRLLQTKGVALVPGEAFHAPGFARLNFAPDESILKPALQLIKEFVTGG